MPLQKFCHFISHPLFLMGWLALAIVSYFYFDLPLTIYCHQLAQTVPYIHHAFANITDFGMGGPYFTIACLLLLAGILMKNKRLWYLALMVIGSLFISGLICKILKVVAGRARPDLYFNSNLYGFYFFKNFNDMWSFPSGHTTLAAAAATAFSFLLPRYWYIFFLLAFIVGISRIIVTAHYLSDVMIGFYLGFIVSYGLYLIARRFGFIPKPTSKL